MRNEQNQVQKKSYSNTERRNKVKIEQKKYIKTFDSFSDGMNALLNSSSDIEDILSKVNESDRIFDIEGAKMAILDIFVNNMPSLNRRENLHYDISMSANKCSIKTDRFVSFGWYIKRNGKNYEYIFHITVFGTNNDQLVEVLLDNGWEVDTYKK